MRARTIIATGAAVLIVTLDGPGPATVAVLGMLFWVWIAVGVLDEHAESLGKRLAKWVSGQIDKTPPPPGRLHP